jgi:hypothetical protein
MDRPRIDEKTKELLPKEESWRRILVTFAVLGACFVAIFLGQKHDLEALWHRCLLLGVIAYLGYMRFSSLRWHWKNWVAYRDWKSRDKR